MPEENNPSAQNNKLGNIFLLALEETIGKRGVIAVLEQAGLPGWEGKYPLGDPAVEFETENISRILLGMEQIFGLQAGRGFALRAGQAAFKYGLQSYGAASGVSDLDFRLLPLRKKIFSGLNKMADTINKLTGRHVKLEEQGDQYLWILAPCPFCAGRETDAPTCQFMVGVLQAALSWLSGGKYYQIDETQCAAHTDAACTFAIKKKPLE